MKNLAVGASVLATTVVFGLGAYNVMTKHPLEAFVAGAATGLLFAVSVAVTLWSSRG